MRQCSCGCTEFYAHQVCHLDVVVDGNNEWLRNPDNDTDAAIYDSGNPFGPYNCVKCGKEYDDLEDIPTAMGKKEVIAQLESLIDNSKSFFDKYEPRDDQIWRNDVTALRYAIKAVEVYRDTEEANE